jgi:UDP-2,3-diacylglucosamine pyrophosphatase LpxH
MNLWNRRADSFRFALLGDLHFDRLTHHDTEWLKREKPNDVHQVENYSRLTRETLPGLFAELRQQIATTKDIAFTAHIGDFIEGLAGTPELARLHCREAVAFVREAKTERSFLFCKGNHDVTGPGSVEAFNEVLLPFIAGEARTELVPTNGANYITRHGDCLFVWYDAYHRGSLGWLEATLKKRTEKHLFVMIHPPVVPYGARANWHLFAKPTDAESRTRLLNLLGQHRAIVLCGHLHKYGTVVRKTLEGPFVQVAVVSVLPSADVRPKDEVKGVKEYGADLVRLEPNFAPETVELRRALLTAEAPFIRHYEYADCPGYGIVHVSGATVTLELFAGLGRRPFRTLPLSDLLNA